MWTERCEAYQLKAKCASYGLGEKILISAEKMQVDDVEARSQAQMKAGRINLYQRVGTSGMCVTRIKEKETDIGRASSTNIRVHPQEFCLALAEYTPLSYAMDEMDHEMGSDWGDDNDFCDN